MIGSMGETENACCWPGPGSSKQAQEHFKMKPDQTTAQGGIKQGGIKQQLMGVKAQQMFGAMGLLPGGQANKCEARAGGNDTCREEIAWYSRLGPRRGKIPQVRQEGESQRFAKARCRGKEFRSFLQPWYIVLLYQVCRTVL